MANARLRLLDDELHALVTDDLTPSLDEHQKRTDIIAGIEQIVRSLWPSARVKCFGSFYTGLMTSQSDLDLVVHHPSLHGYVILSALTNHLRHPRVSERGHVRFISRARVPIIKFRDAEFGIDVDISANQNDGHQSSEVVKRYLQQYPLAKPLVLILRRWLNERDWDVVYHGGLGSYAVLLLVVYFLHSRFKINDQPEDVIMANAVLGFFEYYGTVFDFGRDGMCPRTMSTFQKRDYGHYDLANPFSLAIKDPANPSNIIGANSFQFEAIKRGFQDAFFTIADLVNRRQPPAAILPHILGGNNRSYSNNQRQAPATRRNRNLQSRSSGRGRSRSPRRGYSPRPEDDLRFTDNESDRISSADSNEFRKDWDSSDGAETETNNSDFSNRSQSHREKLSVATDTIEPDYPGRTLKRARSRSPSLTLGRSPVISSVIPIRPSSSPSIETLRSPIKTTELTGLELPVALTDEISIDQDGEPQLETGTPARRRRRFSDDPLSDHQQSEPYGSKIPKLNDSSPARQRRRFPNEPLTEPDRDLERKIPKSIESSPPRPRRRFSDNTSPL